MDKKSKELQIMAHRGIPWDWPENSLLSFTKALEAKADILEFDVRLSKDGIPIIMHDPSIDRTTNGTGLVAELTYSELGKSRVTFTKSGNTPSEEPIPSLGETIDLLLAYPEVLINCEIKDYSDECIRRCIDMCTDAGILSRTYFTCFDYGVLKKIKAIGSGIKIQGFPRELLKGLDEGEEADEKLFDYIGISFKGASKEKVDYYKSINLITGVWVVNDPADIEFCLSLGIDIITTDRADLFCDSLKG